MPEIVEAYQTVEEGEIVVTYGASGDLRRQVEGGAPIEALVLASADEADTLIRGGRAEPASRRVVATNRLVLIGPLGSPALTFTALDKLALEARIAIGDPRTVPAGQYARQAFEGLGLWERLQDQLVYGGHVASVLTYVRRGEVEAAVVYQTEARGIDDVVVLDETTGAWVPVPQVVAVVTQPGSPAAYGFVTFLTSDTGQEIFLRHGFHPPADDEPV
jgi:molybdate transport system substrate-binding protein